jgi:hypothetical protein
MKENESLNYNLAAACSAPLISEDKCKYIRKLAAMVTDWHALLHTAEACRAIPLLYDRLQACRISDIPCDTLQILEDAAIANAARSVHLTQTLADAMEALSSNGIPALTYKGPVLANEAYDNPSLRVYDDLDILVHKKDLKKAKGIIETLGYSEILKLPDNLENSRFRPARPYILQNNDNTCNIDLTDRLTNNQLSFELPAENLWGDKHSVEIDGYRIQTMSHESHILYLCAHGTKHLWFRPTWISDIAGLLQRQSDTIDWHKTVKTAKSQDALRMLLTGIMLADKEYGCGIPKLIDKYIKNDAAIENMCIDIQQIIRRTPGRTGCSKYRRIQLYIKMRTGLYSKIRTIILLAAIPNKNDRNSINLPAPLYPLYILIRPARLLAKLIMRK